MAQAKLGRRDEALHHFQLAEELIDLSQSHWSLVALRAEAQNILGVRDNRGD
jgi:hypothetical protein